MKVLVADPIAPEGIEILKKSADVDVKKGLMQEELSSIIGEYEGIRVRSETKVTAKVIEAGKKLLQILREEHGVVLSGGQQKLEGKIFRIGHLGWVNEGDMTTVISALKKALPQAKA